jgi:hypothetical protein
MKDVTLKAEREARILEVGGDLYRERVGRGLCVCCGETECVITGEVSA